MQQTHLSNVRAHLKRTPKEGRIFTVLYTNEFFFKIYIEFIIINLTDIRLCFQYISNQDLFITLNVKTILSIFHFCGITPNDTKSPKSVLIVCFEIGS